MRGVEELEELALPVHQLAEPYDLGALRRRLVSQRRGRDVELPVLLAPSFVETVASREGAPVVGSFHRERREAPRAEQPCMFLGQLVEAGAEARPPVVREDAHPAAGHIGLFDRPAQARIGPADDRAP